MAKYYGQIGFAESVESSPGVHVEKIVERNYYGELVRNSRRLQSANQLNDNIYFLIFFSIVADLFSDKFF